MGWLDGLAWLLCGLLVLVVVRSLLVRTGAERVPLHGRFHAAREWLEGNGYQVVRVRERAEWLGYYDDREFRKPLVADFIVRKGSRYYAVKLVSPRDPGVSGARLRDQWYPLWTAFDVSGILHIDLDSEQVHIIDFELKRPRYLHWRTVLNRGLWLISGVVITYAWLYRG
ncbi:MAG: hypothetical protein IRZ33_03660 [Alicyclobacillaceae bacterium]|nr:hypothetical protein [Alicyclobacillaceae bacterium]